MISLEISKLRQDGKNLISVGPNLSTEGSVDRSNALSPRGLLFSLCLLIGTSFSVLIAGRVLIAASSGRVASDFAVHFPAIVQQEDTFSLLYSPFYLAQELVIVSRDLMGASLAGLTVMVLFFALKGFIVTLFALQSNYPLVISMVAAFCLIIAMPFPRFGADEPFYLGTIPPNVFHNSTQVLANALAIPAVYCLTRWAATPTRSWMLATAISGALCSLAKPALAPAWLVAFVVTLVWLVRSRRIAPGRGLAAGGVIIAVPTAATIGALFFFGVKGYDLPIDGGKWVLAPATTWNGFVDSIPLAIWRSWAFPIAVLVTLLLFGTRKMVVEQLAIPWLVVLISTTIFFLFARESRNQIVFDGILVWGAIAATSALYVLSFLALSRNRLRIIFQLPALVILGIQAWSGSLYLRGWLVTGSYL